jgi:hypothetical protein
MPTTGPKTAREYEPGPGAGRDDRGRASSPGRPSKTVHPPCSEHCLLGTGARGRPPAGSLTEVGCPVMVVTLQSHQARPMVDWGTNRATHDALPGRPTHDHRHDQPSPRENDTSATMRHAGARPWLRVNRRATLLSFGGGLLGPALMGTIQLTIAVWGDRLAFLTSLLL